MQIAAANPLYVKIEDVPADVIEKEREIYREQMKDSGKPANVVEKIIDGKLNKFYTDVCLLEQEFIKDSASQDQGPDKAEDRHLRREYRGGQVRALPDRDVAWNPLNRKPSPGTGAFC